MKKYSIGFNYANGGCFKKVWDKLGRTLKFETIEEAEEYIIKNFEMKYAKDNSVKIMQGYKVIKIINKI